MTKEEFKNNYVKDCVKRFSKTMKVGKHLLKEGVIYNKFDEESHHYCCSSNELELLATDMWQYVIDNKGVFEFNGEIVNLYEINTLKERLKEIHNDIHKIASTLFDWNDFTDGEKEEAVKKYLPNNEIPNGVVIEGVFKVKFYDKMYKEEELKDVHFIIEESYKKDSSYKDDLNCLEQLEFDIWNVKDWLRSAWVDLSEERKIIKRKLNKK